MFADQPSTENTAEHAAGAARPELAACSAGLRPGDALVVGSLERLSPSLPGLTRVGDLAAASRRGQGSRSGVNPCDAHLHESR